jgi:hypothetical protein
VLTWGANEDGQLGDGSTSGAEACAGLACSRTPVAVGGLGHVTSISAGANSALALLGDGRVMAWGGNLAGQLGDGTRTASDQPVAVCAAAEHAPCAQTLSGVAAISAGSNFSFALLGDGSVFSWGSNGSGQLGVAPLDPPEGRSEVPLRVTGLGAARSIASGSSAVSALAVLDDGELMSWGNNQHGPLGDGTRTARPGPVPVCAAFLATTCAAGPDLASDGQLGAIAVGANFALAALTPSHGPIVREMQPRAGALNGGTKVTISGDDLAGVTAVRFGSSEAREVSILSAHQLTAVSPPGAATGVVEVSVTSSEGTRTPGPESLFTYRGAPAVLTGKGVSHAPSSAFVEGTVDPEESAISECHVEYGTTPALGSSAPCRTGDSGAEPEDESREIGGLQSETTYYFRYVAANARGQGVGATETFTTNALPEVGRCITGRSASHHYTTPDCSVLSTNGRDEWEPWPLPNPGLTLAGGGASFEIAPKKGVKGALPTVSCHASSGAGEFDGPQELAASLTFSGCELLNAPGGTVECDSPEAAAGTIVTGPLEGRFGWQSRAKRTVALDLSAGEGVPLAQFECGARSVSWRGSVLVPVSAGKAKSTQTLKYKAVKGKQKVERFEGAAPDVLEESLGSEPFAVIGLTTTITLTASEAIEIRGEA